MLKKDLAEALGVSGAMVSKLAARGMPTHSIDAARKWRSAHLSQGHTKKFRAPPVPRAPDPVLAAQAANERLRATFGTPAWNSRAPLVDQLRAAMRSVPEQRRHEVRITLCCWDAMLGRLPTLVEFEAEEWLGDDQPWFEIAAGLVPMPADLAAGEDA